MKELLRPPFPVLAIAIAISFLGGAFAVFGEVDDAPGAILIGFAMAAGALVLAIRAVRRHNPMK